ncbi:MAG: hypothetical protein R3F37_05210 [Candidatus Competibacteraceae bacterium]
MALLTACRSRPHQYDEDSPFSQVPDNSSLTLHQTLTIAPYSLKVYVQNGQISYGPINTTRFANSKCAKSKKHRKLSNLMTSSRQGPPSNRLDGGHVSRQTLTAGLESFDANDGKPSPILYATQLFLISDRQPHVYKLSCGHLQDPGLEARHLSINQIRQALGDIFTLQTTVE